MDYLKRRLEFPRVHILCTVAPIFDMSGIFILCASRPGVVDMSSFNFVRLSLGVTKFTLVEKATWNSDANDKGTM